MGLKIVVGPDSELVWLKGKWALTEKWIAKCLLGPDQIPVWACRIDLKEKGNALDWLRHDTMVGLIAENPCSTLK